MTRASTAAAIERLRQQANAVRLVAETYDDEVVRTNAIAAADTVHALANRRERNEPVLELAANASDVELHEARVRQAVRRGLEVFLPSWREANTGMPNLLLRSALFAAANNPDETVREENCYAPLTGTRERWQRNAHSSWHRSFLSTSVINR